MRNVIAVFLMVALLRGAEVSIAAAANVSYALEPLIEAFKAQHPHANVRVTIGSSGKLTAQIRHGASYDIFLSADMSYPTYLYEQNLTLQAPVIYAEGALAMLSQKARNYCADIFVLKDPDIRKIAIANPQTAPYGKAAIEVLKRARLYKKLQKKLVYGESISQTVIYATGAADIGLVAKSSLYSPKLSHFKEAIHWSEVDETLYTPIKQGIVLLKGAKEHEEAQQFFAFMRSKEAQKILQSYGYSVP